MLKIVIVCTLTWGLTLYDNVSARPEGMEDLQGAALMTFNAGDEKEFVMFGAKIKHGFAVGVGDAMKEQHPSSEESDERRKRSASIAMPAVIMRVKRSNSQESPPSLLISPTKSSSSSSESKENERRKRSISFEVATEDRIKSEDYGYFEMSTEETIEYEENEGDFANYMSTEPFERNISESEEVSSDGEVTFESSSSSENSTLSESDYEEEEDEDTDVLDILLEDDEEERRKRSAGFEKAIGYASKFHDNDRDSADNMRTKRSNSEESTSSSMSSSSEYSSSEELEYEDEDTDVLHILKEDGEEERRKRSAGFEMATGYASKSHDRDFADNMRTKRSNSEESTSSSMSSLSSEYSSSEESDEEEAIDEEDQEMVVENERRKRSASFEILTNEIMNLHNANIDTKKYKRSVFDQSSSSSFKYLERTKRSQSFENSEEKSVENLPITGPMPELPTSFSKDSE